VHAHEYLYTGDHPRVLTGLSQTVNAFHHPASGNPSTLADGSTIEVQPGDSVTTEDPYVVDGLEPVKPAKPAKPAAAPRRPRKPREAPEDHPAPESDAEPDPADAEPTPTGDSN
jgi:hypothetical protein